MGLSIKNDAVEILARDLARRHGTGVTEIIHRALKEKAERDAAGPTLWEKLRPLHERLRALPDSGPEPDRDFYDELSGERR
ncbi:antitoxin VapB [Bosea sp. CRIB-10]|nr:antitoxin VapB [Bosea sp. CRIB-10]